VIKQATITEARAFLESPVSKFFIVKSPLCSPFLRRNMTLRFVHPVQIVVRPIPKEYWPENTV
jgi:hypothetical protein